jgi:ubiquinone/menaquinone biosynthesis C-methylase UbiE
MRIYWKAVALIAPGLVYSQNIYEQVLKEHVTPETVWLDLGCGHHILPAWREQEERRLVASCKRVVGIDCDLPSLQKHATISLRVGGSVTHLPFEDHSFDLVTANMVVEHLDDPAFQFGEVNRVLKPEGTFLFHTPNARSYFVRLRRLLPNWLNKKLVFLLEGRAPDDVFKVHYKANTTEAIGHLGRNAGFEVGQIRMVASSALFAVIPPVMIFELMWIRASMTKRLKGLRTGIIAVLRIPKK